MRHDSMVKSLEARAEKLLSRTEAMVLLCSKASTYWSMIKFGFNIPLVLIMSLNNSIKESEKCDLFRRLGQQFLLLSGQMLLTKVLPEVRTLLCENCARSMEAA
jgi:hypothetical protein